MVETKAGTPEEYIAGSPPERRGAAIKVRGVVLDNLPSGYEGGMRHGMISYYVPLGSYPETYNGQALGLTALASRKNHTSLHLLGVYYDPETEQWPRKRFANSGKKLDGLPLDVIGEVISRLSPEMLIERYEAARST